jgi:hypothetical protein
LSPPPGGSATAASSPAQGYCPGLPSCLATPTCGHPARYPDFGHRCCGSIIGPLSSRPPRRRRPRSTACWNTPPILIGVGATGSSCRRWSADPSLVAERGAPNASTACDQSSWRSTVAMSDAATRPPNLPPPWFVHTAWRVHRALYRLSGGRFLWTTSNKRGWGALRLTTIGRKSGQARSVIIGYRSSARGSGLRAGGGLWSWGRRCCSM